MRIIVAILAVALLVTTVQSEAVGRERRVKPKGERFAVPGPGLASSRPGSVMPSGYRIAQHHPDLLQISTGSFAFQKSAADTFYLYGGPTNVPNFADPNWNGQLKLEGRFETASGMPDMQGWQGIDFTQTSPHWRASTTNASTLGGGVPDNHAVISHHEDTDYVGYGNGWDDWLVFEFDVTAIGIDPSVDTIDVRWQAQFVHDTEPQYDLLWFSYARETGNSIPTYVDLLAIDGSSYVDSTGTYEPVDFDSEPLGGIVYTPGEYVDGNAITLRVRVVSDGAWSDEDGLFETDGRGAAAVDDISVAINGTLVSVADWEPIVPKQPSGCPDDCPEGETAGANNGAGVGSGGWTPEPAAFVGDFAKVLAGFQDFDVCRENRTPQLTFVDNGDPPANDSLGRSTGGSLSPTWSYGFPGSWVVNYTGGLTNGEVPLHNEAWSPEIDWDLPGAEDDAANGGAVLRYTMWKHVPLTNGMIDVWHVRSYRSDTGWDVWREPAFRFFLPLGAYGNFNTDVTPFLLQDPERVQIAFGVMDMADFFNFPGTDATPSPNYDNVMFKKYRIGGPVLSKRTLDLANDGFPNDGSLSGSIRWDALDTGPTPGGVNVAGDSVSIDIKPIIPGTTVVHPPGGAGGVLKVSHLINPDHGATPSEGGRALGFADPRILNLQVVGQDSRGWNIATYETLGGQSTQNGQVKQGDYYFDLPDGPANANQPGQIDEGAVFFPGDVIHYYIEAQDDLGNVSHLPGMGAQPGTFGFTDFEPSTPWSRIFTVRGLPTRWDDGTKASVTPALLFWNDFGHRGGEDTYLLAFSQNGYQEGRDFDTYTTKGPSSLVGNGLGSPGQHGATGSQLQQYDCIVYVSGNLSNGLISDGSDAGGNGKSNDVETMSDWHNHDAPRYSVYFGDDFGNGMVNQGTTTRAFINDVVGVNGLAPDVGPKIDNQTAPVVVPTGNIPGAFIATHVAFGGCLVLNDFDEIAPVNGAVVSHEFTKPDHITPYQPMVVAGTWWDRNEGGYRKVTAAFNHDLHYVRSVASDTGDGTGRTAAARLLGEILAAFGHQGTVVTPAPPIARQLTVFGNYPNPFNPSTKIAFSAPRRGELSIKIYDVRGELVRTLLDEAVDAGDGFVLWHGRDDRGARVASGIYLYQVKGFGQTYTDKMALVK